MRRLLPIITLLLLCGAAHAALVVTAFPLARSAAFEFDMRTASSTKFAAAVPWAESADRAKLEWSTDGVVWKTAQDFVRVQSQLARTGGTPDPRMATMLFGLQEGTTYYWRVTLSGPSWDLATTASGTVTTLTSTPPIGAGVNTVTVSPASTAASIRTAIIAAMNGTSPYSHPANDIVLESSLGAGVPTQVRASLASIYGSGAWTWSGTAEGWRRLRVAAGHDITFDGSRAEYDVTGAAKWAPFTDAGSGIVAGDAVYVSATSIPKPLTVAYERPGEDVGIMLYDVNTGETWDGLEADHGGPSTGFPTMHYRAGLNGGCWMWVNDGGGTGKLYVRLQNGVDPNTVRMKLPTVDSLFDLSSCHHVVIDGLHLAYAQAWTGGIGLISVSDIVIKNCRVVGTAQFVGTRTSGSSPKNRVIIKGNRFEMRGLGPDADPSLPVPVWSWGKASKQERIGIPLKGVSVSILDNQIKGVFNGISNFAGTAPDATDNAVNNQYAEATEIDGNTFYGIGDDSIEPEQWCVNQAYANNTFTACYKGISYAPAIGGPLYILRNKYLGRGEFSGAALSKPAFVKMGNDNPDDTAYKLVANNTVVNVNANVTGKPQVGFASSGASYNNQVFNNYVASDGYPIDFGYGAMGYPHLFDANRYRSGRFAALQPGYDIGFALAKYAVSQGEANIGSDHRNAATFAEWQKGYNTQKPANSWPGYDGAVPLVPRTGTTPGGDYGPSQSVTWLHDPHGSFSEGAPELVDAFAGNFTPLAGSALAGAGLALANITHDCGPGWSAYEEATPTVGAVPAAVEEPPGGATYAPISLPTGAAFTGNAVVPMADLAGGFTLLLRVRTPFYDAEVASPILRLMNSAGTDTLVGFYHQNSPYKAAMLKVYGTATQWGGTGVSNLGDLDHTVGSGTYYETYTLVYRPATADTAGYFRVYLGNRCVPLFTVAGSPSGLADYAIPAGTAADLGWTGQSLKLVLGDATDPYQQVEIFDVALWGAPLDDAVLTDNGSTQWGPPSTPYLKPEKVSPAIGAFDNKALASMDAAARHDADLLVWLRAATAPWVSGLTLGNDAAGARAIGTLSLSPTGRARLSSPAAPAYAGYGAVSTVPPATVTALSLGTVNDTTVNVNTPTDATDAHGILERVVTLSRHEQDTVINDAQAILTAEQATAALAAPYPGTSYVVRLHTRDRLNNETVTELPVTTTGAAPADPADVAGVIHVTAPASAKTVSAQTSGLYMDASRGWTVAFWTKADAGDTSDNRAYLWLTDYVYAYPFVTVLRNRIGFNNGTGYHILNYSEPIGKPGGTLSTNWLHYTISVRYATATSAGYARAWRGDVSILNATLPVVTSFMLEDSPRKYVPRIQIGDGAAGTSYWLSDIGVWCGYSTDNSDGFVTAIKDRRLVNVDAATRKDRYLLGIWDGAVDGSGNLVSSRKGGGIGSDIAFPGLTAWDGTLTKTASDSLTIDEAPGRPAYATTTTGRRPYTQTVIVN